jgi:hypothetical protein
MNKEALEALKELQDDLNTQSCDEKDLYGNKWKAWYNSRINKIKQHIQAQANENRELKIRCVNFMKKLDAIKKYCYEDPNINSLSYIRIKNIIKEE